jgi:integrase
MLRLRWTHQGKEYQISLGLRDTPYNWTIAQRKANEIKKDIAYGTFDPTRAKYQPKPVQTEPKRLSTVELFEQWVNSKQATRTHDFAMLANLKRFDRDIATEQDAKDFMDTLRERQSPKTLNANLTLLKAWGNYAVTQGQLSENPFTNLKSQKASGRVPKKAFSRDEIDRLLMAIKLHPNYSCYHDFVYTLLSLGLRPSEAIGLRWGHVDLLHRQVTISESMPRGDKGSSRKRKGTKTGSVRVLDMNDLLAPILEGRKPVDADPEALVFPSPTGKAIDDHNFSQRVWRTICEKAGVTYRPPYNCRHTLLSHAIEEGATLLQAAAIAGHANARMISEVYGHMINRPKMPEF